MHQSRTLDDRGRNETDRRPIQVDDPAVQAGIAAALRQAFIAAEKPRENDDFCFEELLQQLH